MTSIELFPGLTEIVFLMIAVDVGLSSDTLSGLQFQLNISKLMCDFSNLSMNTDKTKVFFLMGGKLAAKEKRLFNGNLIETLHGYSYVGI